MAFIRVVLFLTWFLLTTTLMAKPYMSYNKIVPPPVLENWPSLGATTETPEFSGEAATTIWSTNGRPHFKSLDRPLGLFVHNDPNVFTVSKFLDKSNVDKKSEENHDALQIGQSAECLGFMADFTDYLRRGMTFINQFCQHTDESLGQELKPSGSGQRATNAGRGIRAILTTSVATQLKPCASESSSDRPKRPCLHQRSVEKLMCAHVLDALSTRLDSGQKYVEQYCSELIGLVHKLRA